MKFSSDPKRGKPLPAWIITLSDDLNGNDSDYVTSSEAAKISGRTRQAVNHLFQRAFTVEYLKLEGETAPKSCVKLGEIRALARMMKEGPVWIEE